MLRVRAALTLGSKRYDQHCVAVRLRRTQLPALDRLEVLLPARVAFDAAPGEACSLDLDGGDGAATVFTGRLTRMTRSLEGLRLTAHNGGLNLARLRPAVSYEKVTVGDVIDHLCADAAVDVADRVDGPALALYVADGSATAAEEIARLAVLAGAGAAFDGAGGLHVTEDGGPGGELALRYGREPLGIASATSLADPAALTVIGEGAAAATEPEARWVITEFLAGGGPAAGADRRRLARPELRTTDDAEAAGAALGHRRAVAEAPVRLRLWLHPALEPGMRLELAETPETLGLGECRVLQLVSTFVPGGAAVTEVWATGVTGGASEFAGVGALTGGLR